jgi:hypothetical protein
MDSWRGSAAGRDRLPHHIGCRISSVTCGAVRVRAREPGAVAPEHAWPDTTRGRGLPFSRELTPAQCRAARRRRGSGPCGGGGGPSPCDAAEFSRSARICRPTSIRSSASAPTPMGQDRPARVGPDYRPVVELKGPESKGDRAPDAARDDRLRHRAPESLAEPARAALGGGDADVVQHEGPARRSSAASRYSARLRSGTGRVPRGRTRPTVADAFRTTHGRPSARWSQRSAGGATLDSFRPGGRRIERRRDHRATDTGDVASLFLGTPRRTRRRDRTVPVSMKVILSRKGFDAGAAVVASPVYEDGAFVSLPILSQRRSRLRARRSCAIQTSRSAVTRRPGR